jgi:hypothetical protein
VARAIAEAPIKGIGRTLSETGFIVPSHQGNYRWKEDEVKQLIDDIEDTIKQKDDAYFIGLMVFMEADDELVVLDGQQRLATTIMILSAIRAWLNQYSEYQDLARQLSENFIGRKELGGPLQPRLSLNVANHDAFERYVVNEIAIADIRNFVCTLKRRDPNRILLEASLYCHRRIGEIVGKFPNYVDAYNYILDLVKYLQNNVFVISLVVSSEANAYTIFETLNDRGMELSPLDLVKNYLFGRVARVASRTGRSQSPQLRAMEGRWVQMIQTLSNVDPGTFLKAYWTSRHGRIQRNRLFENMKSVYKTSTQAVDVSVDMLFSAEQYNALESSDDPLWANHDPNVREIIKSFKILSAQQTRPVLLSGLAKFDKREFERLARFLEVLIVRYQLIGGGRTGSLEIACARLAKMIYRGEVGDASGAFGEMKDIYPPDEEFQEKFRNLEEDDNGKVSYLLRKLEIVTRRIERGPNAKELDPGIALTLEHVLPRTPTAEWKKSFKNDDEIEDAIYRLGNLCLMARNKDLGREPFAEKKKILQESELFLTSDIANYADWDMEAISRRQAKLAKYAISAWRFQ